MICDKLESGSPTMSPYDSSRNFEVHRQTVF